MNSDPVIIDPKIIVNLNVKKNINENSSTKSCYVIAKRCFLKKSNTLSY